MRILVLLSFLMLISCGSDHETDVYDLEELHVAYAHNIQLPKGHFEVLVFKPAELCGNTSDAEFRTFFMPYLVDEPYKSILSSKYKNIKIIDLSSDTLSNENVSKLYVQFWGMKSSKDSVTVEEIFSYADTSMHIKKQCIYKNSEWEITTDPINAPL